MECLPAGLRRKVFCDKIKGTVEGFEKNAAMKRRSDPPVVETATPWSYLVLLTCFLTCPAADAGPLERQLVDACFAGKVDQARELIDDGADVNSVHPNGGTALLAAVRPYQEEMIALLIESGADVNYLDSVEGTALIKASRMDMADMVRILLDAGADPNVAAADGATALMGAFVFGHREIVELLVKHGADINASDQFGFTPFSIARKNRHFAIAGYLQARGAE